MINRNSHEKLSSRDATGFIVSSGKNKETQTKHDFFKDFKLKTSEGIKAPRALLGLTVFARPHQGPSPTLPTAQYSISTQFRAVSSYPRDAGEQSSSTISSFASCIDIAGNLSPAADLLTVT